MMFLLFAVPSVNELPAPPPPPPVVVTVPAAAPLPRLVRVDGAAGPVSVTVALPGHYDCTGDDNTSAVCVRDDAQPNLPANRDGDQPGATLGSTDADYGADLTGQLCAIKPELC